MRKTSCVLIWLLLALNISFSNDDSTIKIGDRSDGSRAVPVHRIPLLDEEGMQIMPDDDPLLPFSIRQTCAFQCHSYETIASGWHFKIADATDSGRVGHPWIYADERTGTLIPLSYRRWPGTFHPEEVGLSPWDFTLLFGRHLPGGGIGHWDTKAMPEKVMRTLVSGSLEINCLACHDAEPAHDQAEYANQIARENFRWAAASTSAFSFVEGSAKAMPDTYDYMMPDDLTDPNAVPPSISYHPSSFDFTKKVFFNITRKVPNERCYFCHSTQVNAEHSLDWTMDEDVHIQAGMRCTDCHRNGLNHNMTRGYEGERTSSGNPLADVLSCEGCHLGSDYISIPSAGRMAAPVPKHAGIPPVHFDKLTCTACHSGSYPDGVHDGVQTVKTSLAHALGTHNVNKEPDALPRIYTPVLARNEAGKIAPHHLLWPSYWAIRKEKEVKPLALKQVSDLVQPILASAEFSAWGSLTLDMLTQVLTELKKEFTEDSSAFIAGGLLHELDIEGNLSSTRHAAGDPYLWPVAHDVRAAGQSLGVRGCADCHSSESSFFFAQVAVDSPVSASPALELRMIDFQDLDPVQASTLSFFFRFRAWFKFMAIVSLAVVTLGILTVLVLMLERAARWLAETDWQE